MAEGTKPHLLIVEDDPTVSFLLSSILKRSGYDISGASNGLEALKILENLKPSLILLDMNMPVMNGKEFAKFYHEKEANPVPILVVTASEDAARRAEEINAAGWVSKPFDYKHLIGKINELLANHSST